jgi:hypothetical protein
MKRSAARQNLSIDVDGQFDVVAECLQHLGELAGSCLGTDEVNRHSNSQVGEKLLRA